MYLSGTSGGMRSRVVSDGVVRTVPREWAKHVGSHYVIETAFIKPQ
jgi:hypothetical protein